MPINTIRNSNNSNREGTSLRKNIENTITIKGVRFRRKAVVIDGSRGKAKNIPPCVILIKTTP